MPKSNKPRIGDDMMSRIAKSYMTETDQNVIQHIDIDQIYPNPFQPRQHIDNTNQNMIELTNTIKEHGFFGNLLVRKINQTYQLAFGERRWRAAKMAGLKTLPVQIRDLTDQQMLEIAIMENVQREDLNPIDEAQAYQRMQTEFNYTIRQIAQKVGKSHGHIGDRILLLKYDDIANNVRTGNLTIDQALKQIRTQNQKKPTPQKRVQTLDITPKINNINKILKNVIENQTNLTNTQRQKLTELKQMIDQILN